MEEQNHKKQQQPQKNSKQQQQSNQDQEEKKQSQPFFDCQQSEQSVKISEEEFFKDRTRIGNYRIIKFLDKGSQAIVKLCQKYPDQNTFYVIKLFKKREHASKEAIALLKLEQDNIIKVYEHLDDLKYMEKMDKDVFPISAAVVLQYCANGCPWLYLYIAEYFEASITRKLFKDLIKALEYIHKMGLAHRDIKVENLLFDEDFKLLVNDFGQTESFDKYFLKGFFQTKTVGSPGYKGPEFYTMKMYSGVAADIFAAGYTLYSLQTGMYPFDKAVDSDPRYKAFKEQGNKTNYWQDSLKDMMKYHKIDEAKANEILNDDFKNLIDGMLQYDPQQRYTIEEIKIHPWFTNQDVADQDQLKSKMSEIQQLQKYKKYQEKREIKKLQFNTLPIGNNFKNNQEDEIQQERNEFDLSNNQQRVVKYVEILSHTSFTINLENPEEALAFAIKCLRKMFEKNENVQLIIQKENISQKSYKFQFSLVEYNEDQDKSESQFDLKLCQFKNDKTLFVEILRVKGDYKKFIQNFNQIQQYIQDQL